MSKKELIKQKIQDEKQKLKDNTDKVKDKVMANRSAEILSVFAKHNFYVNGFDPRELRTTLEDLGPTYVKIGQIMSSRSDILPQSYCKELEKLRTHVEPLEASVVRQVIEEETGKKIEELYSEFRDDPLGSASIAQAHFGVLLDGTKVVTKVQRPNIAEMMRKDFVQLRKLASAVNIATDADEAGSTVDFMSVISELEKVTNEELDFRVEADNTRTFREQCIVDDREITCPRIIDDISTERILTMTFVDGCTVADRETIDAAGWDRVEIGKAIIDNYMHQVLDVGIFHGDPHQGNIMVTNGVPCWIDFGMIGRLSDKQLGVLEEMLSAVLKKDPETLTDACLAVGEVRGKVNKAKLTEDISALLERYASFKSLTELDLGHVLSDLTATMKEHHIAMPGGYTMLARSLITIEGVIKDLCPELNVLEFLSKKMIARARANFDLREKVGEVLKELADTGTKAVHLPGTVFSVLQSLSKGRLKINFELTGYEEVLKKTNFTVKNVLLAVFSCVLFSGSCRLCTTNIKPEIDGVPVVAIIGFVISIALAIFTIYSFSKRKEDQ